MIALPLPWVDIRLVRWNLNIMSQAAYADLNRFFSVDKLQRQDMGIIFINPT
jgi:hypothetical protein